MLAKVQDHISSGLFPINGVKIRAFDVFIEECGGSLCLSGMNTTQVFETYMYQLTKESKCSYCERLTRLDCSLIGTATCFISHAWRYQFLDVVAALKDFFVEEQEIFLWFDLFRFEFAMLKCFFTKSCSNNQHSAPNYDFSWWTNTFSSAIATIGRTVLVLSPWTDPIPFTRAW
jgi:hypothetical protein